VAPVSPVTLTADREQGKHEFPPTIATQQVSGPVVVPIPSSPILLSPQHCTVPPDNSAQPAISPTQTAVAPASPLTATGVAGLFVVPLPSSPAELSPQHCTVPPDSNAQAESSPTETAVASVIPLTAAGVHELDPFPPNTARCHPKARRRWKSRH
jgi:hypothetical protein